MKGQFLIDDTIADQITYYHILGLFICLPLDRFFLEVVLISLVAHTLINVKTANFRQIFNKSLLPVPAIFYITVLSTIYTPNLKKALDQWAELLPFLLVPLLFSVHKQVIIKYKNKLFNAYAYSCVVVVIYLFGIVLATLAYNHRPLKEFYSFSFINHYFSQPVHIHATFFSLMVVMATVYLAQKLITGWGSVNRLFICCAILILLAGLLQLSSKTAIISLIIVAFGFMPLYLSKGKQRLKLWAIFLFIVCIAAGVVSRSQVLQKRLFVDLETDIDINNALLVTDSRLDRWYAALQVIKLKPVLGYGAGTEMDVIQQTYFKNRLYHSFMLMVDAHNQYLSFLITGGAIGLIIYLFALGYGFVLSYRNKDLMLTSLMILISAVSVSENVVDANKGIFLYALFFPALILTLRNTQAAGTAE